MDRFSIVMRTLVVSMLLAFSASAREAPAISEEAGSATPVQWKFTAIDGREVDLAKLRGKVVLLDFWATWCAPCIRDLPKVKATYEKLHGQGLEIVGVSMDFAGNRQRVLSFVRKNDMPWPQHYEGKKHGGGGNSIAARFGVGKIPAMFLLDRRGVLVARVGASKVEQRARELLEVKRR